MGKKYAEGVILNLEEMWQESTIRVPMICFLSTGSDPTHSIEALAKKHGLSECHVTTSYSLLWCMLRKCFMSSIGLCADWIV